MNFITHNKAYSLYPRATFLEGRSVVLRGYDTGRVMYATQGWQQLETLTIAESRDLTSSFAMGSRRIGDHKCWTVTLPPTSDPTIDSKEDYIDSNTWTLHHRGPTRGQIPLIHLWAIVKDDKILKNIYVLDTHSLSKSTRFLKSIKDSEHYGQR
jgi:hypothetical protein